MKSRKLSWTREEVILALDLYLAKGMATREDWEELSAFLRSLPLERHLAADPRFRNWQGVRNKLYNLQWLHTDGQQGRENAGEMTRSVWEDFGTDQPRVVAEAEAIRNARADLQQRGQEEPESDEYEADESGVVLRTHRQRERDPRLVKKKREKVLADTGALACEACGFDSEAKYGISGIIECHHLRAVSELVPGQKTSLSDLRLLCPICHRIIHAQTPWLRWEELVALVAP